MKIQPLGERVLLKPRMQEEKTTGGIYIPDSAKENRKEGIVVAVGTGKNGPLSVQPGDTVLYGGYSNEEFEGNGETFVIVEYKDILAKVE